MTPRRDFLGLASGAVAARTIAGASAEQSPHPDAELLRLGDLFRPARAAELQAWDLAEGEFDDDGPFTRRASAASDRVGIIADQVASLSARTLPGLLVRVLALDWHRCGDPVSLAIFHPRSALYPAGDEQLIVGILSDLAVMAGAGTA